IQPPAGLMTPQLYWGDQPVLWQHALGAGTFWYLGVDPRREPLATAPPKDLLRLPLLNVQGDKELASYPLAIFRRLALANLSALEKRTLPIWPFVGWLLLYAGAFGWAAASRQKMPRRLLGVVLVGVISAGGLSFWMRTA